MNRLFILGNGFDLAHGLKTKFSDFLEWYWRQITIGDYDDEFIQIKTHGEPFKVINLDSLNELLKQIGYTETVNGNDINFSIPDTENQEIHIKFKNNFFLHLNNIYDSNKKWVDIELEYYSLLLGLAGLSRAQGANVHHRIKSIEQLNQELKDLILKIDSYFETEIRSKSLSIDIQKYDDVFENPTYDDPTPLLEEIIKEFPPLYSQNLKHHLLENKGPGQQTSYSKFEDSLILNFNYTKSAEKYLRSKTKMINIHGSIKDSQNPINLGFGNESDSRYSHLEDLYNNEYLQFTKSFFYLNNSYYKELIDFLETEPYQVQLLGHSCGLSDGTLLRTIFEHKNCLSIKIYYHEEYPGKDNYTDLAQNISRHFTNKQRMRERIVNKKACSKMPQHNT